MSRNSYKVWMVWSLIVAIGAVSFSSCASRKRKGDVSGFSKFYHNLNAKYNGYFNANEIMEATIDGLDDNHVENYNEILPVYTYGDASTAKGIEADMDIAIEKVTTVATIHEVSDWVDDCYVLMGTAQYLKQDYESAEETFEFFEKEFNPNDPSSRNYKKKKKSAKDRKKEREEERKVEQKKKEEERKAKEKAREEERKKKEEEKKAKEKERERIKKEREQKRKDRLKNSKKRRTTKRKTTPKDSTATKTTPPATTQKNTNVPPPAPKVVTVSQEEPTPLKKEENVKTENTAYHEGTLWLAKTYIERDRYSSAEFLLRRMWNDPTVKDDVKKLIPAAQAHNAIAQKNYGDAVPFLKLAVEEDPDKRARARYAYILAQIMEMNNDFSNAKDNYEIAKKLSNNYELEINAELNMIKNELYAGRTSLSEAESDLLSARKENKNEEYQDRISYVLGEIFASRNDESTAKKYFKESLSYNLGNSPLKMESYYRIAEMDYLAENYLDAKNYYDSTLSIMQKEDERFLDVKNLAASLTDIAKNINIVMTEDSLQRIAALPREQQEEYAAQVLKKQAENKKASTLPENAPESKVKVNKRRSLIGSNFFAYNEEQVRKGEDFFKDRWGDRRLQDNWRRAEAITDSREEKEEENQTDEIEASADDKEIQKIINNLPRSKVKKEASDQKIRKALFALGVLYRDRLENFRKSAETLEELQRRFPGSKQEVEALYYLHLDYLDLNNIAKANQFKNEVVSNYSNTKFGKALGDPNYLKGIEEEKKSLSRYYDSVFETFDNGNYEKAKDMIAESVNLYGEKHDLRPKFGLLGAMIEGKISGEAAYIGALQDVITRYPNTPEQTRAREIMRFLKGDSSAFKEVDMREVDKIYTEENDKVHYMAIVVYDTEDEIFMDCQSDVSNYNRKNHKGSRLQLADLHLNRQENSRIILVRKFTNKEKAMKYYDDVTKNKSTFIKNAEVNYEVYAISQRNYRKMVGQNSANSYRLWFENRYLKETGKKEKE